MKRIAGILTATVVAVGLTACGTATADNTAAAGSAATAASTAASTAYCDAVEKVDQAVAKIQDGEKQLTARLGEVKQNVTDAVEEAKKAAAAAPEKLKSAWQERQGAFDDLKGTIDDLGDGNLDASKLQDLKTQLGDLQKSIQDSKVIDSDAQTRCE